MLLRYAKWRAFHLQNCLIAGEKPAQPAPTPTAEELDEADSFIPLLCDAYEDLLSAKQMEEELLKHKLAQEIEAEKPSLLNSISNAVLDPADPPTQSKVFSLLNAGLPI